MAPPLSFAYIGNTTKIYSIGFGLSGISMNNYNSSEGPGPTSTESGYNIYVYKHDSVCGNYYPLMPAFVSPVNKTVNHIDIFPNPATTQLTIQSTNQPIIQLSITNLLGQTIYTQQPNITKTQVDISALQPGIYFVKINGTDVRKFVKE